MQASVSQCNTVRAYENIYLRVKEVIYNANTQTPTRETHTLSLHTQDLLRGW